MCTEEVYKMNIKTQVIIIIVVAFAMVCLFNMVRKNRLELKYSLLWFVLGIGVLFFGLCPSATEWLANLFGIGIPINLIFFAGFCFALMIIFSLTVAISKMSVKLKRLTQEIGLMRKELEDLRKKNEVD